MSTIAAIDRLSNTKQIGRPLETLILPMRAELRRSAIYVPIGLVPIAALRWGMPQWFPPATSSPWFAVVAMTILAVGPLAVFQWRLRVDSSGIARRRLFRWDLWPWEAFEQGKVLDAEGEPTTYILREKPFWARKLGLSLLEDTDQARVAAIIDRLRVRRPLELPSELALRYGFRKEVVITPGGLLVRDRGQEIRYRWRDVQTLRICRRDRGRRDFRSLEIVLPDRVVKLLLQQNQGNASRSWSKTGGLATPDAETLAAVLERSISPERVRIISLTDPPRTIEEWKDRREMLAKRSRSLTSLRRIFCAAGILMLLVPLMDYRRGIFAVVGMTIVCALAIGSFFLVLLYLERDHREDVAKLEGQMPKE
jgi:hypothetical protein